MQSIISQFEVQYKEKLDEHKYNVQLIEEN